MKKVYIIGAGPAGLTAAYELLKQSKDYEVTVLEELPMETYLSFSELFAEDLYQAIDLMNCVEKRISQGGTGTASVQAQIDFVKATLA